MGVVSRRYIDVGGIWGVVTVVRRYIIIYLISLNTRHP